MEAGQLPPPSVNGGGAAGGGGASAYVVEGWLYKRSSSLKRLVHGREDS